MQLTLSREQPSTGPLSAPPPSGAPEVRTHHTLAAPGITIGSAPENDWVPDTHPDRLGRIQAAVRQIDGQWALINLGSLKPVAVNGTPLACRGEIELKVGDIIDLGTCRIDVEDDAASGFASGAIGWAVTTSTGAASAIATSGAAEDDIAAPPVDSGPDVEAVDAFSDLFGPGTLPLGATPGADTAHPFELRGDMQRNAADPLATLTPASPVGPASNGDPLTWFDQSDRHSVPDVFTDHTPSVLGWAHKDQSKT